MDLFKTGEGQVEQNLQDLLSTPTHVDSLHLNDSASKNYYASSASLCYRKTAWEKLAKHESEARTTERELYFAIGSTFEDVVAQRFKDAGVYLDRELRVEEPLLNLSGRIDFVIEFKNELTLVELKTCGRLPTSPRKGHAAQLLTYMALTGINQGIVWYLSRNVADWSSGLLQAPLRVTPTETSLRAVLMNVALGREYVSLGGLPEKPDFMKKSYCGFCSLQANCWDDEAISIHTMQSASAVTNASKIVDEVMDKREARAAEMIRFYS